MSHLPTLRVRPMNRRGFVELGGLTLGGLTLSSLLQTRAEAKTAGGTLGKGRAAILFFMAGGPSHIDMFDPKPDATAEVRGPFTTIDTTLPGFHVTDLLPRHAKLARELAIVKSVTHNLAVHDDATHWLQTGYPLLFARQRGQTHPSQGSVVSAVRGANRDGMPAYVCVPEDYRTHAGFYEGAAYLGSRHLALNAGGDPSLGNYTPPTFAPAKGVTVADLSNRHQLLADLDRLARRHESDERLGAMTFAQREALDLTVSSKAREAFDLAKETDATRERYGRHAYGQSALLARRLVEAGVSLVTINLYEKDVDWWDDHYTIEKNLRKRLPLFDEAFATLIEDLTERGLQDEVLVAAFGEFGRAPRIDAGAGRGHWPGAMAAVLWGGGIRGGQVVGSTTADGAEPKTRPLRPGDLLATIYQSLGINVRNTLQDRDSRPIPILSEGEPIRELV